MKLSRGYWISLLFAFTAIVSGIQENRIGHFRNTINIDGIGYYAWLPATFIYEGDYNWKFKDTVLSELPAYQNRVQFFTYPDSKGRQVNKYSCGLAVTAMPFWAIAYGISQYNYNVVSGFEMPFQVAMWFNNLFWLLLGIYIFLNLLNSLGFSLKQQLAIPVMLLFGTNLFHFITFDNSLTHPANVGITLMFISCCYRFFVSENWRYLPLLCFAGLGVFLLRPVNILLLFIILLPFLKKYNAMRFIRPITIGYFMIFAIAAFFIYGGSMYLQTGQWIYYSYSPEGFDFSKTHFWELLTGYRCGLFLYTPAALFFFWFLYLCIWRKITKLLFVMLIAAVVYLFSAWIDHCFGCRVGNRPMVDYYTAFLLPLLWVKPENIRFRHKIVWLLPLFCIYYNQVLHYQYRHYIIDWCYMDAQKFKSAFLRLGKAR